MSTDGQPISGPNVNIVSRSSPSTNLLPHLHTDSQEVLQTTTENGSSTAPEPSKSILNAVERIDSVAGPCIAGADDTAMERGDSSRNIEEGGDNDNKDIGNDVSEEDGEIVE